MIVGAWSMAVALWQQYEKGWLHADYFIILTYDIHSECIRYIYIQNIIFVL